MKWSTEKEEHHKEAMLPYVGVEVSNIEQNDPPNWDSLWTSQELSNMEAEAFVLWYQVNE